MHDIRRVIRSAARRLMLVEFFDNTVVLLSAAAVLVLLTRVVERTFGFEVPWREVFVWAPVGVVVLAGLWTVVRRSSEHEVARELDERAGLRESLSTALIIEDEQDPWSRAVVETARERARTVEVRRAVPMEAPRAWPIPFGIAAATAAIWFAYPNLDVLGKLADRQLLEQQQNELEQARADIEAQEKKIESKLREQGLDPLDFMVKEADLPDAADAKSVRQHQVMKLTKTAENIKQEQNSEKGMQLDAMRDALRKLKQPGKGPMDDLSRSLARGDFEKAQEQLKEIQKKLETGELAEEDKAKLKLQMQNMSKQLEQASQDRQQLEKELQQAGMSKEQAKQAAADPEQLKKALEQIKDMSDEQKKELLKQAAAQAKASQQCNNMGQAMKKAAQGMQQGQQGQQGMQELSDQLSEMEMLQGEMGALDESYQDVMNELSKASQSMTPEEWAQCMGGMPGEVPQIGEWRPGESSQQGIGSGGAGQGLGQSTGAEAAPFTLQDKKSPTKTTNQGDIIGEREVYEQLIRGESTAQHAEVFEESAQSASEALDTQQVAPERREAVKIYFSDKDDRPSSNADEPEDESDESEDEDEK
jgi:hypothetical protein